MKGVITDTIRKDISLIYVGVFGRAPDGEGLDYWYNVMLARNADLRTLADWMYHSAVHDQPEIRDPVVLVRNIYSNILGRPYDTEGINYWVGEIRTGRATPGQVVADILWVAATQYKDSIQTKNLLALADIGLQISAYFYYPDLDGDKKISSYEIDVFKSLIDFKKIDLDRDGIISLHEINSCLSNIPKIASEVYKCPSPGARGCPEHSNLINLPSWIKEGLNELAPLSIYLPGGSNLNLETLFVALLSEVSYGLKSQNFPLESLAVENYELFQALKWYEASLGTLPATIPLNNIPIDNCGILTSLTREANNVYYYNLIFKDGKSYKLTTVQFIALKPELKAFLLEEARDAIRDPDSDPSYIAFLNYTLNAIAQMPPIQCPKELMLI